MFYPEFEMEENPFRYWDRATEKKNIEGGFRIVKISAIEMVMQLIRGGSNTIIVGEKGCGKSTVIDSVEDERIVRISGSESFRELYNEIIGGLWGEMDEQALIMMGEVFSNSGKGEFLMSYDRDGSWPTDSMICRDLRCPRRGRCNLTNRRSDLIEQIRRNSPQEINCPLRQWLAVEVCSMSGFRVYLFDVPDKMKKKEYDYFEEFVMDLFRRTGAQIVLMATREQFGKLRVGSEYFMRWKAVEFPPPDNGELEEILRSRVDGVFPFDSDALGYLIERCNRNPRTLIRRGGEVLVKMMEDGVKEPVDVDYVFDIDSGLGIGALSEMDAIVATSNRLWEERGSVWVLATEFVELMEEWYRVEMSTNSLGHKLKRMPGGRLERSESAPRKYKLRKVSLIA